MPENENYIEKLFDVAESLNWVIDQDEGIVLLQNEASSGHVFSITVYKEDYGSDDNAEKASQFINEIFNCYDNFDPDEETEMLLHENGAPKLNEIYEEAKTFEQKIYELYKAFYDAFNNDNYEHYINPPPAPEYVVGVVYNSDLRADNVIVDVEHLKNAVTLEEAMMLAKSESEYITDGMLVIISASDYEALGHRNPREIVVKEYWDINGNPQNNIPAYSYEYNNVDIKPYDEYERTADTKYLNMLVNSDNPIARMEVAKTGYGLDKLLNDENGLVVRVVKDILDDIINNSRDIASKRIIVDNMGYGLDVLAKDTNPDVRYTVLTKLFNDYDNIILSDSAKKDIINDLMNDENEFVKSFAITVSKKVNEIKHKKEKSTDEHGEH